MAKLKNVRFRVGRLYRITARPQVDVFFEIFEVDTLAMYLRSEDKGRLLRFLAIHDFSKTNMFPPLDIIGHEIEYDKSFLGSRQFRVRNATLAEIALYANKT